MKAKAKKKRKKRSLPAKVGRKPWVLNKKIEGVIYRAARNGLKEKEIAILVGVSHETFSRKKDEFPQLSQILERARIAGHEFVTNGIYINATTKMKKLGMPGGNIKAQIYLDRKHRGLDVKEAEAAAGRIQVQIILPDNARPTKVIDA